MNIADGFDLVVRTATAVARPDPELRVDEWSEESMVLPKSAPHSDPFRYERTPYARRTAQVLSSGHPQSTPATRSRSDGLRDPARRCPACEGSCRQCGLHAPPLDRGLLTGSQP